MFELSDKEAPDWLEAHPTAALFFWDGDNAVSQRQRARLELVAASVDMVIGVLDVRGDVLVAQAVGVTTVPALVVFRDGEVMERIMGPAPEGILLDALREPPQ